MIKPIKTRKPLHRRPDPNKYRGGYQAEFSTTLPRPPKATSIFFRRDAKKSVGKLDIEDNREALREGASSSAASSALSLLLSSPSGRKVMRGGGLAGLGLLAYRAHKTYKLPTFSDDVIGLLKDAAASERIDILIQAVVAAAHADDDTTEGELELQQAEDDAPVGALEDALANLVEPETIAALADSDQARREIYAISCRIANGLKPKERDYLDRLAMAMRLDPDIAAKLEKDMRIGY